MLQWCRFKDWIQVRELLCAIERGGRDLDGKFRTMIEYGSCFGG